MDKFEYKTYGTGKSYIADYYGVARGTIQKVQENRTWKHV